MFSHRATACDRPARLVPGTFLPRTFLIILWALVSVVPSVSAQAPGTLHYQGRLLQNTAEQEAAGGTIDIDFSIWTGPATDAGASELWSESWTGATLSNGIFSVLLGSNGSPLDPADFQNDSSLFLQLAIGGEALLPRQPLGSAPFALVDEPTNELQDLSIENDVLSLSDSTADVDLSPYLDNTDEQTLSFDGSMLSISGSDSTVDLSSLADNTDEQDLSLDGVSHILSLTGDPTPVDLSSFLDNTDAQTLTLVDSTLTISGSGSFVDLSTFADNTDAQTLSLSGDTLTISGSGSSVDLANASVIADLQALVSDLEEKVSRTVFLTSGKYKPDFGGLAGADAICQSLADAAGLEGRYMAWLSDSMDSPSTRFTKDYRSFVLLDGRKVADDWVDLTDGTLDTNINVTETGATITAFQNVWTATNASGTRSSPHCSDWTVSTTPPGDVRVGRSTETNSLWTRNGFTVGCGFNNFRLYCFEQ